MALVKIDGLFREFSFLGDYLKRDEILDFRVRRMDTVLLDTNVGARHDCNGDNIALEFNCLILDQNGKFLLRVGSFKAPPGMTRKVCKPIEKNWYKPWTWGEEAYTEVEESVEEIFRPELVKEAFYRLVTRMDEAAFVLMWGLCGDLYKTLIVYKAPRGKAISEWIDREIEAERIRIAAEFKAL